MRKTIAAITLAIYLAGGVFGSVFANEVSTTNTNQVTNEVTAAPASESTGTVKTQNQEVLNENVIKDTAGVLPTSHFYGLERAIEQLQISITKSQEKLAALKAKIAAERAAEAVVMSNEGKEEFADEATLEYTKMLASAVEHINSAIEAKDEAVKTLNTLNQSYSNSQQLVKSLLTKASKNTKEVIEATLNEQDKAVSAVNDFYLAKKAFFEAKNQLKLAQIELQSARKTGDAQTIKLAEEKVKTAEAVKDELEAIKDVAESSKEEIKNLENQTNKLIKSGLKQTEIANDKMEISEDKISDDSEKLSDKEDKEKEKQLKKAQKENDKKLKKEQRNAIKEARKEAREKAKSAKEEAKRTAEKAREEAKNANVDIID